MLEPALRPAWSRDLPVCLPGRWCHDETPAGAHLIAVTSALTPVSPAIAAGCFALLGASLVLVVQGLRLQWRGSGVRPWLAALVAALLLGGLAVTWGVGGRIAAVAAIYSGAFGQPRAAAPPSVTGSWSAVLSAGEAMAILGAVAAFLMLNTAAVRQRRGAAP